MDIDLFPAAELDTVFRCLRTALRCDGSLERPERRFLEIYARITGYVLESVDPPPIAPRGIRIGTPHRRKRLLQLAALAALLGQPPRPAEVAFVRELARELDTRDGVTEVLEALLHGQRRRVRLLAARRAFRVMFKEAYLGEGVAGVLRFLGAMLLKAPVNRDQLGHYKRLGLLPEGSLGREYWKHMTRLGFGFPGEPGGIPQSVVYHDVGHVLTGHETTPLGEIQQGSFQAGNRREDGFFFIQFVILQFHHGIRVTPAAPPFCGHFDPEKVLWALHRGARCSVDFTHQWDFWPLMPLSLEEARARCGLMPALSGGACG